MRKKKSKIMNDSKTQTSKVLIMGGGIGGLCAALSLAELNIPVVLVEKSPAVGGILNQLDQQFPNDHCGICRMLPMVNREDGFQFCASRGIFQEKITVMTRTMVTSVSGTPGRFYGNPGRDPCQALMLKNAPFAGPAWNAVRWRFPMTSMPVCPAGKPFISPCPYGINPDLRSSIGTIAPNAGPAWRLALRRRSLWKRKPGILRWRALPE